MKTRTLFASTVAFSLLFSSAHAVSIGIDFIGGGPNGTPAAMAASEVAGLPGIAQANWNSVAGASGTNVLLPLVSTGLSLSGATVTWSAPQGTWSLPGAPGAPVGDDKMMMGYLDASNGANSVTVSVNIPAGWVQGPYDVYVYFDGDNAGNWRVGNYSITAGPSDGGEDSENTNFYGTIANHQYQLPVPGGAGNGNFVYSPNNDEGNYVKLAGLTTTSFTLTGTGGATVDIPRAPINGIQIVGIVPEPSSLVLIGFAAMGLAAVSRKRLHNSSKMS